MGEVKLDGVGILAALYFEVFYLLGLDLLMIEFSLYNFDLSNSPLVELLLFFLL